MGGPQGQGLPQLLVPVGEHLGGGPGAGNPGADNRGTGNRGAGVGRQPLDQVQAPAAQSTPPFGGIKPCGSFNHIGALMAPPQGRQNPIVKALPPQADAVDAGGQPAQQTVPIETGRIGLKRDLRPRGDAEALLQCLQQGSHLGGRQQRRGSAPEVDGGQGRALAGQGNLLMQQGQVGGHRGRAGPLGAIGPVPQGDHREVTVKTSAMAKGNVQISGAGQICGGPGN